jgi:hypothetical protein
VIRQYHKQEIITAATFPFTQRKLQYQLQYQGKNGKPDKRFDSSIEGLCIFLYLSGTQTFYAVKKRKIVLK